MHTCEEQHLEAGDTDNASEAPLEPQVLTDEGIRRWAENQRRTAEGMAQHRSRRSDALVILGHVNSIFERLAQPDRAVICERITARTLEILSELQEHWRKRNASTVPPIDVLTDNAKRYAYCECRRDVMHSVREILALRGASGFNRRRLPNYRRVKRMR